LHRKKSSTREDIHVLGLALEVRRIEQQLSQMNASIGDAQTLLSRSVTSVDSPVKQTQLCTGLAGKVSRLAKQIVRDVGPCSPCFAADIFLLHQVQNCFSTMRDVIYHYIFILSCPQ